VSSEYTNKDTARRAAVSKAWANERALVLEGKGTRNWSKSQQAEIVSTGRCKGYYGHHKLSVKNNPEQAGNPDNIQFVTRKEHIKAHDNNFRNDPKGRYNPETGKVAKYKDGKLQKEPVVDLKDKLSDRQKQNAVRKYDARVQKKRDDARERARELKHRNVEKVSKDKTGKSKRGKAANAESASKTSQSLKRSRENSGKTGERSKGTKTSQALGMSRDGRGKTSGVSVGGRGKSAAASGHAAGGAKGGSGHGASSAGGHGGGHGASGGSGAGHGGGGHGGGSGGGHGGHGK